MSTDTILVIDDDPETRCILRRVLQAHGYAVQTACNDTEGLHYLSQSEPALVLLDVHLPKASSARLAAHVQATPQPPLLVLMSSDDDARFWASDIGALGFLPKPFSFTEVLRVVHHLHHHQPHSSL